MLSRARLTRPIAQNGDYQFGQVRFNRQSDFSKLERRKTFLYGRGVYDGRHKKVLLTVVNNYQLKRLEEAVFGIDSSAFFFTESNSNVIGRGFLRRRVWSYLRSKGNRTNRNFIGYDDLKYYSLLSIGYKLLFWLVIFKFLYK